MKMIQEATTTGEAGLMMAILMEAIRDLREQNAAMCSHCKTTNAACARNWIASEAFDGEGGITFNECCEALGLDPDYLRLGLVKEGVL